MFGVQNKKKFFFNKQWKSQFRY